MNVTTLKLLVEYLLALPSDYQHFDMEFFHEEEVTKPFKVTGTYCDTAACAVGHAPYVDGLPQPKESEDWYSYSERIFGLVNRNAEWEWCFSGAWSSVDNTPHGAAKRILWLIENGLPSNLEDQLNGKAQLCYL